MAASGVWDFGYSGAEGAVNIKRSSASRGELTKAMSATLREVRLHHDQIAALLAGMQQLMDGQAALGEAFEALKGRVHDVEVVLDLKIVKVLNKMAEDGSLNALTGQILNG